MLLQDQLKVLKYLSLTAFCGILRIFGVKILFKILTYEAVFETRIT